MAEPKPVSETTDMEECRKCSLAVYCFSDPDSWVFRTLEEMEEKKEKIENCPWKNNLDQE